MGSLLWSDPCLPVLVQSRLLQLDASCLLIYSCEVETRPRRLALWRPADSVDELLPPSFRAQNFL